MKRSKRRFLFTKCICSILTIVFMIVVSGCNNCKRKAQVPLYKNAGAPVEKRIDDLLGRMSLEVKVGQLSGTGFETSPVPGLDIPVLKMADGPAGIRWGKATAFPSGVGLAATWCPALVKDCARIIALETLNKGRNVLLGPCVNIHRHPLGGRNFESYGEDPYLASRLAASFVEGVQEHGVIASIKHFACNNQESNRMNLDVHVDERTLREIYLPAFKTAVKEAGVWSVMSAYNKIGGTFCSENRWLLDRILKTEWGFKGFTVSDWDGTRSTAPAALAGLDLEMPTGKFFGKKLLQAVKDGKVKESIIDEKLRRLFRVRFLAGMFDRPESGTCKKITERQRAIALFAAENSIVLLKNDNDILPLNKSKLKTLAIIGPNASSARTGGGGSSRVTPPYSVSPLDGVKMLLNGKPGNKNDDKIKILYHPGIAPRGELLPISPVYVPGGWKGEYFDNPKLNGKPVQTRTDKTIDFNWEFDGPVLFPDKPGLHNNFSVRWTGEIIAPADGIFHLSILHNNAFRLYIDDRLSMGQSKKLRVVFKGKSVRAEKGKRYRVRLEYSSRRGLAVIKLGWQPDGYKPVEEAVKIAKQADAVMVCAGLNSRLEGEGHDRRGLRLPNQDILISAIVRANPHTIVVLNTGGPVAMSPWLDRVPAVLQAWYPGQEGGTALANILFGNVAPCGKLPVSFIASPDQSPAFKRIGESNKSVHYHEGIFTGYRYLDKHRLKPLFPFGHGLSYTRFHYSGLNVLPSSNGNYTVSFKLKNTGKRKGVEIIQLYIKELNPVVPRPEKELKAFKRELLLPGESFDVSIPLTIDSLKFFHPAKKRWTYTPGEFEIMVGASSRDIRLRKTITIN